MDKNWTEIFQIDTELIGNVKIIFTVFSLITDKENEHYSRIKQVLVNLQKKMIQYEDEGGWNSVNLIVKSKMSKYDRTVTFFLHQKVYEAPLNFFKCHRKYELNAVIN